MHRSESLDAAVKDALESQRRFKKYAPHRLLDQRIAWYTHQVEENKRLKRQTPLELPDHLK